MPFRSHMSRIAFAGCLAIAAVAIAQNQTTPYPPRNADAPRADNAPREKRADLMGRVASVSPDGRSITLSMSPRAAPEGQPPPREARPEQATFTLSDRTQVAFFGVGEGEAKPAPGLMAMVWLDEGSKDQAARVRFMRREGEERPDVQGRVAAVSPDGRTVTIETREGDRPTGKVDLRIAPYTQSLYYGVDQNGAKPTVDYLVVAWLEKGSKDTPARIRFMKGDPRDLPPAR
jgi:hypothetical protein